MTVPNSRFPSLLWVALMTGAAFVFAGPLSSAQAASCPTVAEPAGLQMEFPHQMELVDLEGQTGVSLDFSERSDFATQVAAGALPPVEQRLPEEPLVVLPYVDCGKYGGTLRGFARAYESGTSEILSWRQLNMVRYSDDMATVVPNVAKGWKWNDDYTEITFYLRKGHKWSDGEPFTADDVVFWANDIINNKDIHKQTPFPWSIGMRAEKIDETTVMLRFDKPYPAGIGVLERYRLLLHPLRQHALPRANAYQVQPQGRRGKRKRPAMMTGWRVSEPIGTSGRMPSSLLQKA